MLTNPTLTYDELKAAQDFFEKHGHADCDENNMSDGDRDCIRCGKKSVSIHTCTPCPTYRAGMKEGELIQQKLNEELKEKYEKALAFIDLIATQDWLDQTTGQSAYEDIAILAFNANKLLESIGAIKK